MEILNQITVLVSNPPQGSGNLRRLKKTFERATASSNGLMNFEAFCRAMRYPLKKEVLRKLYDQHFNKGEKGPNYEDFQAILKNLEKRTREDRIKDILNFYKDERGMISFDDFKNIIDVALQQIDFQIGEVELHRLVETILQSKRSGYEVERVRKIIEQWDSLHKRIGDILYLALFLKPKIPLDPTKHNNRFPTAFRPRPSVSNLFFVCLLSAYAGVAVFLSVGVWAFTWASPLAAMSRCVESDSTHEKSKFIRRNASFEVPLLSGGTAVLDSLQPGSINIVALKNVVTELLNFHLLFVSLLTLKSMKVALCKKPLCLYLNREDVRLVLWIVAFTISVLCIVEYALLFSRVERDDAISTYLSSSRFLFKDRTLNQIASAIKILMIGITLIIRLPGIRNRLVHFTLDIGELNLNVFVAIHLLQDESFLKWAIMLIVPYLVDGFSFAQIKETRRNLDANFCSSSGGLIVETCAEGMDFMLGDVYFLIVDQVAVNSIVPAWVISSPSDKTTLKLLLHEGHWQTKVLRQLLKDMKNEIGNFNVDLPNFDANCSTKSAPEASQDESIRSASEKRRKLRQRNVSILSSGNAGSPTNPCWPHTTTMQMTRSLKARIIGPFRSVHFDEYAKYSSIMLLITPKSAGAVVAFLQHHLESGSQQKVVLFFAATEFRRVEWFIASLVQLELFVMSRHLEHGEQDRLNCESCRLFFRVYLTSATKGQDARIMWVQLAMAVLAGERSDLIKQLQRSLYPDMNVVALDKELFQNLEFLLCDADFPYTDACSALAGDAVVEIRHF